MPAGRPLKFETPEEFEEKIGKYFKNEKHLCDFIEENIYKFADAWVKGKLKSFKREWGLKNHSKRFGPNQPRIDFMLEMEDGKKIGIECKNTKRTSYTLSQLLSYNVIAESNNSKIDELVLICTSYDKTTFDVIKKFSLPIRYIIMGRKATAEVL